jgi:PAS domain S-box-containing protein
MAVSENRLELRSIAYESNLYQRMVEEIQDYAIIVLDKKGYIQNWNKGAQKIKLYFEEEIIGKHFSIFYLPQDLEKNLPQRLLTEAENTGAARQEVWRKRKDGSTFWGSITITAIHDDDGKVIGFCKITRDLTDRKLAEDNLRVIEERYHQMIAEVQDYAIILMSVDGVIKNWNIGAEKIKGYSSEEILGKNFQIFYTSQDRERGLPLQLLAIAKKAGRATHEGWRVRKDGSKFWGSITITALHNKNTDVIGFSKVTRDLTQQKIAEEKLAEYTSELEIQNSELEQFAYIASHDLQEPLRKIQTFAELIKENFDNKEFVEKYFQKLETSAKRMSELVHSLLSYSRLSKDRPAGPEVDLNVVLQEVKDNFELLIEEKRATITNEHLPKVLGNHTQLGQLFSNLISNSLKFSQQLPLIQISSSVVERRQLTDAPKGLTAEHYYLIGFQDNGIGFEKQYKEKIFSFFQRLHGKHDYAGTGIGLALCKKIAENHNGFISADSELGDGALFCVYLPVTHH